MSPQGSRHHCKETKLILKALGLPCNKYLKKLYDTTVYGDAYLFKLITEDQKQDGSGTAMFHDLGRDFTDAADKNGFPKEILGKLLAAQ